MTVKILHIVVILYFQQGPMFHPSPRSRDGISILKYPVIKSEVMFLLSYFYTVEYNYFLLVYYCSAKWRIIGAVETNVNDEKGSQR